MTRTLADMTPDERQECVGRWAEVRRHLVIIAEVDERRGDAWVFRVETSDGEWHNLPDLTPRLDLPRAWAPTGDPVPAGADALDTLARVQKVADLLDQMAEDNRKLTHLDWVRDRAEGQAHSYTKAAEIIREATGGTE